MSVSANNKNFEKEKNYNQNTMRTAHIKSSDSLFSEIKPTNKDQSKLIESNFYLLNFVKFYFYLIPLI